MLILTGEYASFIQTEFTVSTNINQQKLWVGGRGKASLSCRPSPSISCSVYSFILKMEAMCSRWAVTEIQSVRTQKTVQFVFV
jgi:hypothetical protein